jgi:hypothetical protein
MEQKQMAIKTPLDLLTEALSDFEKYATRDEKKSAIPALQRHAKNLEIKNMELLQQRLLLTAAESKGDKQTIQELATYSQFTEISEWASEILHPKVRTPGFLGMGAVRI